MLPHCRRGKSLPYLVVIAIIVNLVNMPVPTCATEQSVIVPSTTNTVFTLDTAFSSSAVSAQKKAAFRIDLPSELKNLEESALKYKIEYKKTFKNIECLQKERIGKRFEIVDTLVNFIQHNLERKTDDGLLFAACGINDLRYFLKYFQLEKTAWEHFPDNPAVQSKKFDIKRDFGAKGDGKTDDYPAFARAVAALQECRGAPAVLKIPAGIYLFEQSTPPSKSSDGIPQHLLLEKIDNAVIEGESPETTKFLFGNINARGAVLIKAQNVSVRNLSLQYQRVPFFQGAVLAVDVPANTVTVQQDPGTMALDDPLFSNNPRLQCATAYEAQTGRLTRTHFLSWTERKLDKLGEGKYRVYMDKKNSVVNIVAGVKLVIPNRDDRVGMFPFGETIFCSLENIHVRNARAGAFGTWGAWWCSWSKCKLYPLPGLHLAANADFLIAANGSYCSDCEVSNPGDDCFNSNVPGFDVSKVDGAWVTHPYFAGIAPTKNDMLLIYSSATGQCLSVGSVKNAVCNLKNQLDDEFSETVLSRVATLDSLRQMEPEGLNAHGSIRDETKPDTIYFPHMFGIGSVVRNCHFSRMRSGINIQTPCSLVENNVLENLPQGAGITVSSLLFAHEGPVPYCVTIRNNRVTDAYYGLRSVVWLTNLKDGSCPAVSGLVCENNSFDNAMFACFIKNTGDSRFINNDFKWNGFSYVKGEEMNQFLLLRSGELQFLGNKINGQPLTLNTLKPVECKKIAVQE